MKSTKGLVKRTVLKKIDESKTSELIQKKELVEFYKNKVDALELQLNK